MSRSGLYNFFTEKYTNELLKMLYWDVNLEWICGPAKKLSVTYINAVKNVPLHN